MSLSTILLPYCNAMSQLSEGARRNSDRSRSLATKDTSTRFEQLEVSLQFSTNEREACDQDSVALYSYLYPHQNHFGLWGCWAKWRLLPEASLVLGKDIGVWNTFQLHNCRMPLRIITSYLYITQQRGYLHCNVCSSIYHCTTWSNKLYNANTLKFSVWLGVDMFLS